jgi:hypothetical protein
MTEAASQYHDAPHAISSDTSAETIVGQLDDELVRALGLLHKAPRGIPELAIASLDYGSRTTLEAYRLISSKTRGDKTLEVTITDLGKDVIKLCSENLPTLEDSELAAAIEDAQDLLSLASQSSVRAVHS